MLLASNIQDAHNCSPMYVYSSIHLHHCVYVCVFNAYPLMGITLASHKREDEEKEKEEKTATRKEEEGKTLYLSPRSTLHI